MASNRLQLQQLTDEPRKLSMNWAGYVNFTDKTLLPSNVLTFPTKNCFIPSRDKVVVRQGSKLLGEPPLSVTNKPIIGNHKKFATVSGYVVEVRVTQAFDADNFDIMEVLFLNPTTLRYEWFTLQDLEENSGGQRYYFTEWWDEAENIGRLIAVNGSHRAITWSGGIAQISAVTGSTVSIASGTWDALGFRNGAGITVNGTSYTILSGVSTNTLTLTTTSGISVGDIATDILSVGVLVDPEGNNINADYVETIKNHVCYGNFKNRTLWGSSAFDIVATAIVTNVHTSTNDLVITNADNYNETTAHSVKIQISKATPASTRDYSGSTPTSNVPEYDNAIFGGTFNGPIRDTMTAVVLSGGDDVNVFLNGSLLGTFTMSAHDVNSPITFGNGVELYWAPFPSGTHEPGDGWQYVIGGEEEYDWYVDNVLQTTGNLLSDGLTAFNVDFSWITSSFTHAVGDFWVISLEPEVRDAYRNFYYSVPSRKPGQGFKVTLPSNFWTMIVQEDVLYVNVQSGKWIYLELILSADLLSEKVSVEPLKSNNTLRAIYPYMIGHFGDYIGFVTTNKILKLIGRKKFLQLPQSANLSDPVRLDFISCSFENGSMEEWDDKWFISSPNEQKLLCFDNAKKYWQPPQEIPECGMLSVVNLSTDFVNHRRGFYWNNSQEPSPGSSDYLIAHSDIRNLTNTLFVGTNDNGNAFQVRMRTGYLSYSSRWATSEYTMTFIEGYMQSLFNIHMTILAGIEGGEGMWTHLVVPKFYQGKDRSVLGGGSLASHELGSDTPFNKTYFREIYPKPPQEFYFAAIDLYCNDLDQTWSLLGVGMNAVDSRTNNESLLNVQED
jgi:hypothetical protein